MRTFGLEVQTADEFFIVPQPAKTVDKVIDLRDRIDPARYRKPNEFHGSVRLNIFIIPRFIDRAAFHTAGTGCDVDRGSKAACRILPMLDMRDKLHRVDMTAKTARRSYDRDARCFELIGEILDKLRSLRDDVLIKRIVKADTDSFT